MGYLWVMYRLYSGYCYVTPLIGQKKAASGKEAAFKYYISISYTSIVTGFSR